MLTNTENAITLNDIFGKEITGKDTDLIGILFDEIQGEIFSKSWRSGDTKRISAYREWFNQNFQKSKDFLRVSILDDIREPMHLTKIFKQSK